MDATTTRPRKVAGSLPAAERKDAYIAALQRDLNHHLSALGAPTVLTVDGDFGAETEQAFKRVCRMLGVEPLETVRTFRVIAGAIAPRSDEELRKAATD